MPKYTLTYFNIPGRAELSRLLFSLGGIEFEDKRITHAEWPALKDSAPLKQLPILEIEGQDPICQSGAIERYIARQAGLLGNNDAEAVEIDMLHMSIGECSEPAIPYFFGETSKDEEKKEALRKTLIDETLPVYLDMITRKLEANDGGDFLVGSKASMADIRLYLVLGFLKPLDKDSVLAEKYPKLFALVSRVRDLPAIRAFNEKQATSPTIWTHSKDV